MSINVFSSNICCSNNVQFHGWAEFTTNSGRHVWAKVSDESCGDFGYRWAVTFYDRMFGRQEVEVNDVDRPDWFGDDRYAVTFHDPAFKGGVAWAPLSKAYGTLCRAGLKRLDPDDYDPVAVAWDLWEAVGNAAEQI
jgi:hypothetical protein